MKKIVSTLRGLGRPQAPFVLLISLAILVVASYVTTGVLVKPNGDDYGWLNTYHQAPNWFSSTFHMMQHDNGRYAQNLSVAIPYGIGGAKFLQCIGFISIFTFVGVAYLAVRAALKVGKFALSRRLSAVLAGLFVLAYTTLSVVFVGIPGNLDNTYQDFMWYPGFITYTFPLLLLIGLCALTILYRQKLAKMRFWPIYSVLGGFIIGMYGEATTVIYLISLGMLAITALVIKRNFKRVIDTFLPFLWTGAGLIVSLGVIYTSPASTARRQALKANDTMTDVLHAAVRGTHHYLTTYLVGSWHVIVIALAIGATIACYLNVHKHIAYAAIARVAAFVLPLSAIAGGLCLFAAFVIIFKAYGLTTGYIVPRFEILYNLWFTVAWISAGAGIASGIMLLAKKYGYQTQALTLVSTVLLVGVIAAIPMTMQQIAGRTKQIAVYSQKWDDLQDAINAQIAAGDKTIHIPTIDMSDGYGMPCSQPAANWLGDTKAAYYHVNAVCDPSR